MKKTDITVTTTKIKEDPGPNPPSVPVAAILASRRKSSEFSPYTPVRRMSITRQEAVTLQTSSALRDSFEIQLKMPSVTFHRMGFRTILQFLNLSISSSWPGIRRLSFQGGGSAVSMPTMHPVLKRSAARNGPVDFAIRTVLARIGFQMDIMGAICQVVICLQSGYGMEQVGLDDCNLYR